MNTQPSDNLPPSTLKYSPYVKLLLKFSDITMPSQSKPAVHVKHNTEHHIETRGPPVFSKARRLDPEKLQAAKREFQCMVSQGWCRQSKSARQAPFRWFPKKMIGGHVEIIGV
ncbi:hypothetical protein AVEN_79440-1 [Araneus ventricosus]|uniref:Uncharacterized protein n=1 Tax=Araneus ventricosus TaxID=182803 RepID=A0A4Y2I224_ARAVE|nr:hypothetical protein AVEN_79440-1 [Araneus ventricosus]